jgi:NAD(P)-dependent dehydrogenase (short-subunit alcohol dehydrogenase family)
VRAFVTGATSGIGRATAVELERRGHEVVATGRRVDLLESVPATLQIVLDVRSDLSVAAAAERAGPVDVIVNAAGLGFHSPVESAPVEEVRELFETNFFGPLRVTQALLAGMRERGGGVIVNVSSAAGRQARPFTGLYAASKAALELMSEALSYEVERLGIRVLIFEPGSVVTGFQAARRSFGGDRPPYDEMQRQWARQLGAQVTAGIDPEEVGVLIADAIEAERWPFRTPVGRDAEEILRRRSAVGDEEYRAYIWSTLDPDRAADA